MYIHIYMYLANLSGYHVDLCEHVILCMYFKGQHVLLQSTLGVYYFEVNMWFSSLELHALLSFVCVCVCVCVCVTLSDASHLLLHTS